MKINFNLTELTTVKHQPCYKCVFDKIPTHHYCAQVARICLVDSQIYVPTENLSDVFRL